MEIDGQNDSKTLLLRVGFKEELGRGGFGSDPDNRLVSRRHVSLELVRHEGQKHRNPSFGVRFEAVGRNPIWVFHRASEEIRVFRRSEKGEMEAGDMFCLSAKRPVWLRLKRIELDLEGEEREREVKRVLGNEDELAESLGRGLELKLRELESLDVSDIDPVKEYGFLILGHEFDDFPKKMVQPPKNWNWFLEEPKRNSEDDEDSGRKRKKGVRRKRKRNSAEGNDDEEWTGESEDEEEMIAKIRKSQRPKYSTRSVDCGKAIKDAKSGGHTVQKKHSHADEDYEEDDDDGTLGGFIVTDEGVEEEGEEIGEEEEEEEEFDEEIED